MDTDELKGVLEKHQKYLSGKDGGEMANLRGANLCGANLCGADLSKADLRGANLNGANLNGADLRGAGLRDADLRWAVLIKADLFGADLSGANLRGADLSWADLSLADLRGADIDYSCWPLWCGSKSVKIDAKIARQLAAHFCVLGCDDPEYLTAREAILEFSKKSHRAEDLGIVS